MAFPSLPREGLTLEFLLAPLSSTIFSPLATTSLLIALLRYPEKLKSLLPKNVAPYVDSATFLLGLKALTTFNVLRKASDLLSNLALGNFNSDGGWDWKKEIVVVTGGSYGIGEVVARRLAERGVKVVVLARTRPSKDLPPSAVFYPVDLASASSIREVCAQIRADHGAPTVLINNAGVAASKTILSSTAESLTRTFAVNSIAQFLLVKEFLPSMIEKSHGHVVTVASLNSFLPHAGNVDYACSKAAELAFHEGLTVELRERYKAKGVRTSIIHPSWIRTPMATAVLDNPNFKAFVLEPETVADSIVAQVLGGRSGQVVLPRRLAILALLRALPAWFQEATRSGIAHEFPEEVDEGLETAAGRVK